MLAHKKEKMKACAVFACCVRCVFFFAHPLRAVPSWKKHAKLHKPLRNAGRPLLVPLEVREDLRKEMALRDKQQDSVLVSDFRGLLEQKMSERGVHLGVDRQGVPKTLSRSTVLRVEHVVAPYVLENPSVQPKRRQEVKTCIGFLFAFLFFCM